MSFRGLCFWTLIFGCVLCSLELSRPRFAHGFLSDVAVDARDMLAGFASVPAGLELISYWSHSCSKSLSFHLLYTSQDGCVSELGVAKFIWRLDVWWSSFSRVSFSTHQPIPKKTDEWPLPKGGRTLSRVSAHWIYLPNYIYIYVWYTYQKVIDFKASMSNV